MTLQIKKTDLLLLKYAAGSLRAPTSILVITWLILDYRARQRVAKFEAVGGQILLEETPTPLSPDCLEIVLQKIETLPQHQSYFNRFRSLFLKE